MSIRNKRCPVCHAELQAAMAVSVKKTQLMRCPVCHAELQAAMIHVTQAPDVYARLDLLACDNMLSDKAKKHVEKVVKKAAQARAKANAAGPSAKVVKTKRVMGIRDKSTGIFGKGKSTGIMGTSLGKGKSKGTSTGVMGKGKSTGIMGKSLGKGKSTGIIKGKSTS